MCEVEDAEPWSVVTVVQRKAAKEHRCTECFRTIRPGEVYQLTQGLCDGAWDTWKTCPHCLAAAAWLLEVCRGWVYGGVFYELVEHFHEGFGTVEMGRMIANMRRKWHDGRDPLPEGRRMGAEAMAAVS